VDVACERIGAAYFRFKHLVRLLSRMHMIGVAWPFGQAVFMYLLEIDGADPDVRRSYPDERGSLEGGNRYYDHDEVVHFLWTTLEGPGHLDRPYICICLKLMEETRMCVGAIRMNRVPGRWEPLL